MIAKLWNGFKLALLKKTKSFAWSYYCQEVQPMVNRIELGRMVTIMEQPKPGKRFVSINGEDVLLSSIPEEEWKKMARILNDRFMREVGMFPVNKDE